MKRNIGRTLQFTGLTLLVALAVLALVAAPSQPALAAKDAPTIQLFPTTVVENIRRTGETARTMEQGLQGVIEDLEQQMKLYEASKCEGAEADYGCGEISRQMGEKYMEMLDQMESDLPTMERSIEMTRDSLQKRIRQELGRKATPRDLQKMLEGKQRETQPYRPRRHTGRLSEKFRQYHKLVSMGARTGAVGAPAAVASEIYLDTQEVLDLIALTKDEISRAKLHIELGQMYGMITPEMFDMVAGVKTVIFGEVDDPNVAPTPPPGSENGEFVSPLAE